MEKRKLNKKEIEKLKALQEAIVEENARRIREAKIKRILDNEKDKFLFGR